MHILEIQKIESSKPLLVSQLPYCTVILWVQLVCDLNFSIVQSSQVPILMYMV